MIDERQKLEISDAGRFSPVAGGAASRGNFTARSLSGAQSSALFLNGKLKSSPTNSGVHINRSVVADALATADNSSTLLREKREVERLKAMQARELEEFRRKELMRADVQRKNEEVLERLAENNRAYVERKRELEVRKHEMLRRRDEQALSQRNEEREREQKERQLRQLEEEREQLRK